MNNCNNNNNNNNNSNFLNFPGNFLSVFRLLLRTSCLHEGRRMLTTDVKVQMSNEVLVQMK